MKKKKEKKKKKENKGEESLSSYSEESDDSDVMEIPTKIDSAFIDDVSSSEDGEESGGKKSSQLHRVKNDTVTDNDVK